MTKTKNETTAAIESHAEDCAAARKTWGAGPWNDEPDRVEFRTKVGFPGIALREPRSGHWCGYVGVEPGHPWHGTEPDARVHGGITYGNECVGAVCHVPQPGEPEHLWWVGFDCAHSMDRAPSDRVDRFSHGGSYRTIEYVRNEIERLAEQAVDARPR